MSNVEHLIIEARLKRLKPGELRAECFRSYNWSLFHGVEIPLEEIISIGQKRIVLVSSDGFHSNLPWDSCIPEEYLNEADYEI